jgi:uncharacterized protein YigE (DUF2233 family)
LNLNDGSGNFYLKPNGVFAIAHERTPGPQGLVTSSEPIALVRPASAFEDPARLVLVHATQSGPLLLESGVVHPKLDPNSTSVATRNAVGVDAAGTVFLVVSRDRVSFYALVELFTRLRVSDALYLDGNLSTLHFPAIGAPAGQGSFGPLIAVVE